jgi:hypothetical protein
VAETFQCWIKEDIGSEGHHQGMTSGVLHDGALTQSSSSSYQQQPRQQQTDINVGAYRQHMVHASSDRARQDFYRKRLTEIFMQHDPSKVAKIDLLLSRYKGNEERFVIRTAQQYEAIEQLVEQRRSRPAANGSPWSEASLSRHLEPPRDQHGLSRSDYRERLLEIFQQNEPSKAGDVEAMLERFKGQEMQLVDYLLKKYRQ